MDFFRKRVKVLFWGPEPALWSVDLIKEILEACSGISSLAFDFAPGAFDPLAPEDYYDGK